MFIFPNPANDLLHVSFAATENYTISIIDNLGKEVLVEAKHKDIDISTLASGVYYVKVVIGDQPVVIKKLLVN